MIPMQKQQLREKMRLLLKEKIAGHIEENKEIKGRLQQVIVAPVWKQAASVLLYAPLPYEINVLGLLEYFPQKKFFFPKVAPMGQLELYEWTPEAAWMRGAYGLREPDPSSCKQVAIHEVDLALIPGLAFDRQGGRLGRGEGFYDRLLSLSSWKAFKMGVAWPWQIVEAVPREAHDVLMDAVITSVDRESKMS